MPEPSNPEQTKLPEQSILPVGKETIDKALTEIAQDPRDTLVKEMVAINMQNPLLRSYLDNAAKTPGGDYFDFMEGACWTHKILRMQAEKNNIQLPQISADLLLAYFEDKKQAFNEMQSGQKKFVLLAEEARKVAAEDPEFLRALNEFIKYRSSARDFHAGLLAVYTPIKNALQSKALEEKFNT